MTKTHFHLRQFRLLLLVLLCALFSIPLSAQEAYVVQSTDQRTLTFYYDNNRKSRSGETWGIDEKSNESSWVSPPVWAGRFYSPNNVVTKVVFDASFKVFRPTTTEHWFYKLSALTTIEGFENLNTSEVTDMSWMFYDCSSLTSLNVSNFNTSKVTNMSDMFAGCSGLKELKVSNFNTSKVTSMNSMFSRCSGLKELNISNFNTSAVTNMNAIFANCSDLETLNLSNFNTSEVTNMGEMFSGCSDLKELNVSNFNTSKVTDMSAMFYVCSDLTELNVSNFNTSKVTDMKEMFYNCFSLTSLNISNFNTSEVKNMGEMFYGCSRLTELNVSNFNTSKVMSMWGMFYGCSRLKTIFNIQTWRCKVSDNMFYGCAQLKGAVKYDGSKIDVTMANFETGYFRDPKPKAYVQQSEDKHTLTFFYDAYRTLRSGKTWDIDEKSSSSRPVWTGTNEHLDNVVTKVVFDASFKDFRPITTERWFYYLSALTTIEGLEYFNTSAVTDMSEMFSGCSSLTELNVSNFNTSKVTDMSEMFRNCSGLKTILNLNTWRSDNSQDMFKGCTQLRGAVKYDKSKLDVTMANPETGYFRIPNTKAYVQQSEDKHTLTFFYDINRTLRSGKTWDIDEQTSSSKPVWEGTYEHPNGVVTKVVFDDSFKNCRPITTKSWFANLTNLTTIEGLENLNTSAVTDMSEMFSGCHGLKELNVSNFNTSAVTNMEGMFSGCYGLKELNVSNFNTSKVTDMSMMFRNCSRLAELNVSNFNTSAVMSMGRMFSGCSHLTELNVSNFNTSKVTDMGGMFEVCSGLTSLNLSNFNTSAVTNMASMFGGCHGLTELNVSNFNTSAVTNMIFMFYGCDSLTSLNVSNFKTSAVTSMYMMFSDCSGLKELNLSNFKTSAVTSMGGMFDGCSGLTSLNLSNFNTSAVMSMRRMFRNCSGLKTILNTNTWRCEESDDMFEGCTQLKGAVKFNGNKLDATMANPEAGYFFDPNKKIAYVLQSEDQHKLTFYYDNNRKLRSGKTWDIDEKSSSSEPVWAGTDEHSNNVVTKVVFDTSFKDFRPTTTEGWFYHLSALTTIEGLENLNTSAVTNMRFMFEDCSRLTELNVSNFNTSAVKDMSCMFYRCSSLTELNVSNFNTSEVTNMGGLFYGCSSLTSLNISNFNTSKVTKMEGMFYDCSSLTSLNVSNFNASKVTNMEGMFYGCSGLTSLNVSNFNIFKVTYMGRMFYGCSGLKTIFNTQTWRCEQSQNMFYGCTQLKGAVKYDESKADATMANPTTGYFTYPNRKLEAYVLQSEDKHTFIFYYDNNRKLRSGKTWDIDEKLSISKNVWTETYSTSNKAVTKVVFDASFKDFRPTTTLRWFYDFSALTTIEGLENLNTSKVTDMRAMFHGCSSLTSLNVSNFETSAVTDMNWMFSGCSSLKTILNPNTWRCEKSQDMFKGCTQLKGAVKYDGSKVDATMANPTTGYFSQELPTAIGRVIFEDNNATQIYDLQGKRVNANQRHLPAGFYIVNGKKVYLNEKP